MTKLQLIIQDIFTYKTYSTASSASGTATLTVKDISGFAVNQILLIGQLGSENSEIIKTHGSTAPTGSTITLASNLVYTHPADTPITVILYDQIEISHSLTVGGSKTLLAYSSGLFTMSAGDKIFEYRDSEFSSGYYWLRYKNSITSTYSDYTGPIPYTGYDENTVGKLINKALKRCHLFDGYTDTVDREFCLDEINECLRFISGKLKRWSKLQVFDYNLGYTQRGVNKFTLPTDIAENENNKSIYNIRIGGMILKFKRYDEWISSIMKDTCHTQVRTQATAGQITLDVDNSFDFPDSGSVNVYITGTIYTITYTGVTRSATAGVLTGIPASGDGAITVTIPIDTDVWYGESEVEPVYYTVYGGYVYIELPAVTSLNKNVLCDYNSSPDKVSNEGDVLDVFRFDACLHWLIWAINATQKNKGKKDMNEGEYLQFIQVLADYIRNEIPAHRKHKVPRKNGITYRYRDQI